MEVVLAIIMTLLLFGGIGFVAIKYKDKITTSKEDFKTAQDLLDIKEVNEEIAVTKDGRYIKILQVSSINYFLLSDQEKSAVDGSFGAFLMSLNFPIQFYVQTRLLDLTSAIESLKQDVQNAPENLHDYGRDMIEFLSRWISMRTVMVRTPYIVFAASSSDPEEAHSELQHRQQVIMNGLTRCGLSVHALRDREMTDLWYAIYNKNRALIAPLRSIDVPLYVKGDESIENTIKNSQ